ncbi:Lsr2 family DNA-binding protein [Williamsia muralis]|uniref:Lsr2 family DNA-binding protein n=1 Tax=Williamsia marianensis TaxID=85044 RepID=UPI003F5CD0CB
MGRGSAAGGGVAAPTNTVTSARATVGDVRSWALANHCNGVGMRGRLSQNIIEAYNRAH